MRCSTCHIDPSDDEWCILFVIGWFIGAELFLPGVGVAMRMQPGTILVLRSSCLEHFNAKWTGVRFVMIATSRRKVVSDYQTPLA